MNTNMKGFRWFSKIFGFFCNGLSTLALEYIEVIVLDVGFWDNCNDT